MILFEKWHSEDIFESLGDNPLRVEIVKGKGKESRDDGCTQIGDISLKSYSLNYTLKVLFVSKKLFRKILHYSILSSYVSNKTGVELANKGNIYVYQCLCILMNTNIF